MPKPFIRTLYAFSIIGLCFFSCKKHMNDVPAQDDPVVNPPAFALPAATPVNGSVSGRVIDENDAPVSLAIVECAGATASTDADGFFSIDNVILDKYISTVKVTKPGYFKGYRSFCANADRNLVYIKLIPKTLTATISGSSAETVTLPNSSQISFQANGMVIKSSGAAYSGLVSVYASYIDPTRADIAAIIPGSLMGADDKNLYALQSTGMIAVELESAAGEPLQLAANKPATIKLLIPTSLSSEAPSTIDTWSLDERGIWKKEGTAPKSGNFYEMQVTHFSFWNADMPQSSIYVNIHLVDQNGNPLSNMIVALIPSASSFGSAYGITDISGNISGMVPADLLMHMNITPINFLCNSLSLPDIGPFAGNASLTVVATIDTAQILTITGTVNDCTGQPLQSGTVRINKNYYYGYGSVVNGNYTVNLLHCDQVTTVNINMWDNVNSTGDASLGSFTVAGNSLNVPLATISCGVPFNIYDGVYSVESGWVQRYTSPGVPEVGPLNGDLTGNPDVYLVTTAPNTVTIPAPGNPGALGFAAASNSSIAGIDPLEIAVDGSNNTNITSLVLANLANWAGHINSYDPATKTFHLSFTWINTAGAPREYEIVLKYKQPRP